MSLRTILSSCVVLLSSALALGPSRALAHDCPVKQWPTAGWQADPSYAQAKSELMAEIDTLMFTRTGTDEDRRGTRTEGLLVIKGGKIIYEKYADRWSADKPHLLWSVTKSLTSTMVGAAAARGLIDIDQSICTYRDFRSAPTTVLPDGQTAQACDITVRHLLEFASGFDWKEVYEDESNQQSSVLAMLYGTGHRDAARFLVHHPFRDKPGTSWMYSTGESVLLAAALGGAVQDELGEEWPWALLFDPLGMTSARFERDAAGTYLGGSYVYATPRDLAKVGYLFMNGGCWEGQHLLSDGWVDSALTPSSAILAKPLLREPDDVSGWQWWLNKPLPSDGLLERPYAELPEDAFIAFGHWGQRMVVVPSLDLIIVRTGDDRKSGVGRFTRLNELVVEVIQ